jgi:hypothetical protein
MTTPEHSGGSSIGDLGIVLNGAMADIRKAYVRLQSAGERLGDANAILDATLDTTNHESSIKGLGALHEAASEIPESRSAIEVALDSLTAYMNSVGLPIADA